jgi:hypothetical protein
LIADSSLRGQTQKQILIFLLDSRRRWATLGHMEIGNIGVIKRLKRLSACHVTFSDMQYADVADKWILKYDDWLHLSKKSIRPFLPVYECFDV